MDLVVPARRRNERLAIRCCCDKCNFPLVTEELAAFGSGRDIPNMNAGFNSTGITVAGEQSLSIRGKRHGTHERSADFSSFLPGACVQQTNALRIADCQRLA